MLPWWVGYGGGVPGGGGVEGHMYPEGVPMGVGLGFTHGGRASTEARIGPVQRPGGQYTGPGGQEASIQGQEARRPGIQGQEDRYRDTGPGRQIQGYRYRYRYRGTGTEVQVQVQR